MVIAVSELNSYFQSFKQFCLTTTDFTSIKNEKTKKTVSKYRQVLRQDRQLCNANKGKVPDQLCRFNDFQSEQVAAKDTEVGPCHLPRSVSPQHKPWKLTRSFLQSAKPLQPRQAFFLKKEKLFLKQKANQSMKTYVNFQSFSRLSSIILHIFRSPSAPVLFRFCYKGGYFSIPFLQFLFSQCPAQHSAVCSVIK